MGIMACYAWTVAFGVLGLNGTLMAKFANLSCWNAQKCRLGRTVGAVTGGAHSHSHWSVYMLVFHEAVVAAITNRRNILHFARQIFKIVTGAAAIARYFFVIGKQIFLAANDPLCFERIGTGRKFNFLFTRLQLYSHIESTIGYLKLCIASVPFN